MADYFNADQVADFRECFKLFDKDGNGALPCRELATVMRSLGPNPTDIELRDMLKSLNKDINANVSFEEFMGLMKGQFQKGLGTEEDLRDAFKTFDKDNKGFVTVNELKAILTSIGDRLTGEEVEDLMKMADLDGDGKMNYSEFAKILAK